MVERFKFKKSDIVRFSTPEGNSITGIVRDFYAWNGNRGGVRHYAYNVEAADGYIYRVDEDDLTAVFGIAHYTADYSVDGETKDSLQERAGRMLVQDIPGLMIRAVHVLAFRGKCRTAWDVIQLARSYHRLTHLPQNGPKTTRNILATLDEVFPGWKGDLK